MSENRTITTEDELETLPVGTVVLSAAYLHHVDGMPVSFQKWYDEAWYRGGRSGSTHPDNFLPAILIHEGRPGGAYIVECEDLGPGDQIWFKSYFDAEQTCGPFPSYCLPKPVGADYDGPTWVPE